MKKIAILLLCASFVISGCAVNFYKTTPRDKMKIEELQTEVDRLSELRKQERDEFEKIKKELERGLKDKGVGVELQERGLVITLADNILFDSGKAKIKEDASPVLDQIIGVIKTAAGNKNIGIEGHTDNVPIKYSGWKSNRELSTARANEVYHYLKNNGVDPARMTTMGYGEYRPIASNDTDDGKAKNRRVEIVILPEFTKETKSLEEERSPWVK